jgi:hypothetical protein
MEAVIVELWMANSKTLIPGYEIRAIKVCLSVSCEIKFSFLGGGTPHFGERGGGF